MTDNSRFASSVTEEEAFLYLKNALPLSDLISADDAFLKKIARHALSIRDAVPWSGQIPEPLFKACVLFPRINDEDPCFYQEPLFDALYERVRRLSMADAIQEVNLWCYENVYYQSADDRTLNALSVLKRGFGRCGEESTLLVSALRSVGIPARQVYVPRWSHCDDNHAWVEAWADGQWYYLGACEPEPVLNSGWFCAAASKAMLVHTRMYGLIPDGERVEKIEGNVALINRTAVYADTVLLRIRITRDSLPLPDCTVRFEVPNMGEFYPILEKKTDEEGCVTFLTGRGGLHLHFSSGSLFSEADIDLSDAEGSEVSFSFEFSPAAKERPFRIAPPAETREKPSVSAVMQAAFEQKRISSDAKKENVLKTAKQQAAEASEEFPAFSGSLPSGSGIPALRPFLSDDRFPEEDRILLLKTLRDKDLCDTDPDVLTDALEGSLPYKNNLPEDIYVRYLLSPRAENEKLCPYRKAVRSYFAGNEPADGAALMQYLHENIRFFSEPFLNRMPDPRAVLKSGCCPEEEKDLLFCLLARALGIPARLNPYTGDAEYYLNGSFVPADPESPAADKAFLSIENDTGLTLLYRVHLTLAVLDGGIFRTLSLPAEDQELSGSLHLSLYPGLYRLTFCMREPDGTVSGYTRCFSLSGGETVREAVSLPGKASAAALHRVPLPPLSGACIKADSEPRLPGETLLFPSAEERSVTAVISPGEEPTEHFLNEVLECRETFLRSGISLYLILPDLKKSRNEKLLTVLSSLPSARLIGNVSADALLFWQKELHAQTGSLPFAAAVSEDRTGIYSFSGYRTGSVLQLLSILNS